MQISAVLMNPDTKDFERQEMLQKIYSKVESSVKNEFNRRFAELV